MVKIYSYKTCSTCKKAIKFLEGNGIEYKLIDIAENPPSKADLKIALKGMDGNVKKLFNTSGQVYRNENYSDKIKTMTEAQCLDDLSKNGKLVKRPVLISGESGFCGFKEEIWNNILDI